jgi:hypothetical protein
VLVYFPRARQPVGKAMDLSVRKDATMEEVIGFALWSYWEEGWLPKLDEGLNGEDDPKWAIKLSAVGWIMRIAEDDGEVDDEFPRMLILGFNVENSETRFTAPDRTGKISKFNFDAYAVLEASSNQGALYFCSGRKCSIDTRRSSPESDYREQNSTSAFEVYDCEENRTTSPWWSSSTCNRWPGECRVWIYIGISSIVNITGAIVKSRSTNIPPHTSC